MHSWFNTCHALASSWAVRLIHSPVALTLNTVLLTAKQQLEEDPRVRELMTSRGAQQKLRRVLDAETLQGRRLFKMLPDAFVFSYAGGEGNLVKLSFRFRPNPRFHPPSLEARVFHDMEGEMWVDCKQERRLPLMVISHSDRAGDKGSHFSRDGPEPVIQ
jgi:hypothetical protein